MKVIQVKDAATGEPQEVPGVGIFPQQLAGSELTEAEWRARIKKDGLPLEIKETKDAPLLVAEGGES